MFGASLRDVGEFVTTNLLRLAMSRHCHAITQRPAGPPRISQTDKAPRNGTQSAAARTGTPGRGSRSRPALTFNHTINPPATSLSQVVAGPNGEFLWGTKQ